MDTMQKIGVGLVVVCCVAVIGVFGLTHLAAGETVRLEASFHEWWNRAVCRGCVLAIRRDGQQRRITEEEMLRLLFPPSLP